MKKIILFTLSIFVFININAQSGKGTINGSLQNSKQEPLAGISVEIADTKYFSVTNEEGAFSLKNIPVGKYTLLFSGVGYKVSKENIIVKSESVTVIDLQLNEVTKELVTVTVKANLKNKYLHDISTSGTRLPLDLVETPQTIQVIPNQLIVDQKAQNLNSVVKNMTGVTNNNMYTSYTMRGFASSYYNQFITQDGYIGNMYQWTQMTQLYNIDRVEYIAGPASALFSTGSPGGVINMVTKKPLEKAAYSFGVTTGSWDLIDVAADLSGPLTKDKKLLYRLNIGYNNQNSFRPRQYNDNLVIAPSFDYIFSNKTNLIVDYVYTSNNSRFGQDHGGLLLMNSDSTYNWKGVDNKFLFNSPKDYSYIANNNITIRFNHQFNDKFKMSYMSRYIWSHQNTGEHYGNYYTDNYFTTLPDSMQRNYDTWDYKPYNFQNSLFATITTGSESFSQTIISGIDIQFYGDRHNRYVDGPASAISFTNPEYSQDNFNYKVDSLTFVGDQKLTNRQFGAYVQDLINIKSKLKFLISLRYENFLYTKIPNSKDNYTQANDSSVANVVLPRIGIVYNLTNDHTIYTSYCESFSPQWSNLRSSGGPFPPQKGQQYEIGYKGLYFGSKLMASVALYSIKYVNILATDPTDNTGVRQIVIPGLTSNGAEFTVQGNINQFNVIAGYAYNQVVFSENSPLGPKGARYDNAPNSVANVWIKYTFPFNTKLKGLNISAGGNYVGNKVGSSFNQHFLMPAYALLDAAISYDIKKFNIGLNGNNLLNKNYALGYYASDLMVQVGTPINWKLSLRYAIR